MSPFSWSFLRPAAAAPTLADGRPLRIQPVTPAARPLIVRGLARISPETSRRRFFTVRRQFSDAELDALTDLDGENRFALGATVRAADGDTEPVGVARFARLPDAPAVAEIAILVVDAFQGQGVGRVLLKRLASAALAKGIARFRGIVQPDNRPVIRLLTQFAAGPRIVPEGELLAIDVDLGAMRNAA